jgi:uncharacterized damage-inducible protein DinB
MSEPSEVSHPSQLELLLRYLQREREGLIGTLDGLSDYDVRRPIVPSGTSLLGLVKHVATVELGYFGECVGRPWPEPIPWDNDEAMARGEEMYALADESREMLLDLYRRSWVFSDHNIRELGLDAPAHIPWWPPDRKETTVGYVVVHMLAETAHHAGHADILRESIDGRGGRDHDDLGDEEHWSALVARIQAAADAHRSD